MRQALPRFNANGLVAPSRAPGRTRLCLLFFFLAAALLGVSHASAQNYFGYYGKNKVQYKNFHWKVLETENFNVYYYEGTDEAVMDAARMAERSYKRIAHLLEHEITDKVPLVLYASHTDFQSTNIQPGFISEGTGGVTEFLKRRVYLPFTGSYAGLEHVMTHELVHAFQVDIFWGGDQGASGMANPFAYQPPLWIMEGSAEYLSLGGLDPLTEMWLRDGALQGYLISLQQLSMVYDIRVYRYGQSIFEYVGRKYGVDKVGKILKNIARTRSVEAAFREATGLSMARLSEDWTEEIRKTYLPQVEDFDEPDNFSRQITDSVRDRASFNLVPGLSPEGDKVAFVTQRGLTPSIMLASTLDGKVLATLAEGERSGDLESLRFFNSSIDWSPDGKYIAFPAKTGGQDAIYVFDIDRRKQVRRIKPGLDGIASPSWSPDGKDLVFTGFDGGRSDLFLIGADGKNLRRLTRDRYSAMTPRFHPDGTKVIFTTDRGPDTDYDALHFGPQRMAVLDMETQTIEVLPGQAGKSISPHFSPDGKEVIFVSDRSGVSNIYRIDLETGSTCQLTNILTGVTGITAGSPPLTVARSGKRLVFSAFDRGGWDLFAIKSPYQVDPVDDSPLDEAVASADHVRRATGLDDLVRDFVTKQLNPEIQLEPEVPGSISAEGLVTVYRERRPKDIPGAAPGATLAGIPEEDDPDSRNSAQAAVGVNPRAADEVELGQTETVTVVKDSPGGTVPASISPVGSRRISDNAGVESVLLGLDALPDTASFQHRRYRPKFSADYGSAAAGAGGGIGVAGQAVVGFSDLLGDKQIQVGAAVYGSLAEADLIVRYLDLGRRTNYGVSAFQYKSNFLLAAGSVSDRYQSNIYRGAEAFLSRPFSFFTRMELGMQAVAVTERIFHRDFQTDEVFRSDLGTYYYFAPMLAYVKDTAIFGPTGPIKGKRLRLQLRQAVGGATFTDISADLRNYWHLGGRYSLAMRFMGASSFGHRPQIYRIGGPFTLRAVPYGALEGSNILLGNVEFRFPFLNNMDVAFPMPLSFGGIRGALFFDVGSAWGQQYLSGELSDSDRNDLEKFRPWTTDGGFRLDDLVAAYGFGIRANLGYFLVRWDLARATDFQNNGRWRGYFALGAEF